MRILWLSNAVLSGGDRGTTGSWLAAMAQGLVASGAVTLGNIAVGMVTTLTRQDCGAIKQWIEPVTVPPARDGLPSQKIVAEILRAVEEFSPDLIHVWGVENYLGLLTARKLLRQPALLEMQGLKWAYAKVFGGGLTAWEQAQCIGLKEILGRSTIYHGRRRFQNWGRFEEEMIAGHRFVTTQSDWIEAQTKRLNPDAQTFHMDLALRTPFVSGNRWRRTDTSSLFCSAAYPVPYKGLHVAIRAVAILKERFGNVALRIAGSLQRAGIRRDGYVHWLNQMIDQLGITENVVWLGPLTADQIVHEMHASAAMVIPTFIENCCTAMQEAMMIGIPVVASYAGGLPSLARDEKSALFFPLGDEVMCAYQTERVLTDGQLARRISRNARAVALERNNPAKIVAKQLDIYRQVIATGRAGKK